MSNKIETIIFDLGGVLIDWNPQNVYQTSFDGNTEKINWFLNNVCTMDWNVAQDAGRTIEEANRIKIAEFPEYEKEIKMYYSEWPKMLSGVIKGTFDIFEALKKSKNYNYYALTNWSAETWPIAVDTFPFLKTFEGVVVSGEVKMRKPFDPIYNHILDKFNLDPKTCIFIDDNIDNIATANRLGIHGIHFQSSEQLAKELKKLGIAY
jgi:2-haloacid dehalogenase